MISILYINYSNDLGGAEKSLLKIIQVLDSRLYRVSVLTFGSGNLSAAVKDLGA